jgi:hypothetical protein
VWPRGGSTANLTMPMSGGTLIAIVGIVALLSFGMWSALKPRFRARRVLEAELRQPIPEVTPDDVKRIVRRDFPSAQFEDVMAIVTGYRSRWESSIPRVQLAALKLANGHMESLRRYIDAAKQDYRDVLVPAEYPKYWKVSTRGRGLSKHARHQVFESDRKRYENWLHR